MREFLKRAKADYLLSSVLCIVLGIIFVVWKGGVIDVIGTILSVAMIIVGIIYLGSFILSLATFGASTIVGILVLAVGIWFLIQPSLIVSLVPVILGVGLVFHGIRAVTEAVNAKKYGYEKWGMDLVFAIICLVCGLVCVFCPLGVLKHSFGCNDHRWNYLSGKLYFEPCNIWSINDCRNSGTCSWNLVSHPAVADCQSGSGYIGCRTCISWNSCGDGGCECQKIRI